MPVVKGGVWTNIEDEILKAAVSKYGLNQWARVSSLLARKTPKQCKARWSEWLDPSIRKIEWSKEEDEKLLHLAKLMPTQWRSIAPIVGRTATQCLERYQKLLDDAEARENDDLGLGGPEGGENKAPTADDVRRLRPGETDPDPESKPARPDTIDMDEDEKEMLSEARARLANTQGKKAKRKARERQLEESRRLAQLQKRRELKNAGINIKITTRKPGQMDYNADVPFQKAPAPGLYDTTDELARNERERLAFDPKTQNISNKRKSELEDEAEERKRRKSDKEQKTNGQQQSISQAAIKAAQMQKMREAERSGKRRSLNLPAPQVNDSEMEDIIKMGLTGSRAGRQDADPDDSAARGLTGRYSNTIDTSNLRTPMAPQEEDRIANEIKNARARTETQSVLLGGDNPELFEGEGTTGYSGAAPSKQTAATPNPLATPYRQGANGASATPMRTPRDHLRLNDQTPQQAPDQTPYEQRAARMAAKQTLAGKLSALSGDEDVEFEFDAPEYQDESVAQVTEQKIQDARLRDAIEAEAAAARSQRDFKRQTQVIQQCLPRPRHINVDALLNHAQSIEDPVEAMIAGETALLVINDAKMFGGASVVGEASRPERFTDNELDRARMEIALEMSLSGMQPGPMDTADAFVSVIDDPAFEKDLPRMFEAAEKQLTETAMIANTQEKKLDKLLGGYQARAKTLRQKMGEAYAALQTAQIQLETKRMVMANEEIAAGTRLDKLREEVQFVMRRERTAQETYKQVKDELDEMEKSV